MSSGLLETPSYSLKRKAHVGTAPQSEMPQGITDSFTLLSSNTQAHRLSELLSSTDGLSATTVEAGVWGGWGSAFNRVSGARARSDTACFELVRFGLVGVHVLVLV